MYGFKKPLVLLFFILSYAIRYCTFGNDALWLIFASLLTLTVLLALGTYDHDYWSNRGVFSPPAWPFVGHIWSSITFKEQAGLCYKRIYDAHKDKRILGTHQFYVRTLLVCDPELIRKICVNDFQHFVDRGMYFNREVDPLAESVLYLRGGEWKKLRAKISPLFSPNKLRGMYPLIETTADDFVAKIKNLLEGFQNGGVFKCEKLAGGFTADAIVPCAFGVKSHVMHNDHDPFAVALHAFYELSPSNILQKTMLHFWPKFAMFFRMRNIPKKTQDFFYDVVTNVLRSRERGELEKRGDFIDMMMALRQDDNNNNSSNNKTIEKDDTQITDMIISANAFIIFLGGFETTSSTLAFMLLELAADPRVQDAMRREVMEVLTRNGGHVSYDQLQELTYMDMVINETLRLYPPFATIQRQCTKDYTIPGTKVVVEEGTILMFPTLAIQRDEQYFEQASAFIPERWRRAPPPGVFMPFGDGPRYCLGKRFAILQMKCCLVRLLSNFSFSPAPNKSGDMLAERAEPFPADARSPITFHPADSTLKISLLPRNT
ncbi:cytochrome P450 6B2 [Amyelois transitella]|uniref:cytochrome P450 6B2 n=1 Tax=Amyelois transitella TaxID=680683 RepID=UPI0029903F68|nr:cytochrome P450 6B2 [Amyelois transitella]